MESSTNKTLHISLWVAQIVLALIFTMAGSMKAFTPIEELAKNGAWMEQYPMLVRFIGFSELAGAIGVILPALTRIKPILTPTAASCLVVVMVLAFLHHLREGEAAMGLPPVGIGFLAAFVAWGRFSRAPIQPRR